MLLASSNALNLQAAYRTCPHGQHMATKLIRFNLFNMWRPWSLMEIKVAINVDDDEARR